MLSIDPKKTKVALIGTSKYTKDKNLSPLPRVERNIHDLQDILTRIEICGIPSENIVPILNWSNPSEIAIKVRRLGKEAKDTFIVYYAGHGKIGGKPVQLHLALCETTGEDLQFNALSIEWLRNSIMDSGAQKKSSHFMHGFLSP